MLIIKLGSQKSISDNNGKASIIDMTFKKKMKLLRWLARISSRSFTIKGDNTLTIITYEVIRDC